MNYRSLTLQYRVYMSKMVHLSAASPFTCLVAGLIAIGSISPLALHAAKFHSIKEISANCDCCREPHNRCPTGPEGSTGARGFTGPIGSMGNQGPAGSTGPSGSRGLLGPIGALGSTGPAGLPGTAGATGVTGFTGAVGFTGAPGPTTDTAMASDYATTIFVFPVGATAIIPIGTNEISPVNITPAAGQFTIGQTGMYLINWSLTAGVETGTSDATGTLAINVNGVAIDTNYIELTSTKLYIPFGGSSSLSLNQNDIVTLEIAPAGTSGNAIFVRNPNINFLKVSP
jgi:hypothetical protein